MRGFWEGRYDDEVSYARGFVLLNREDVHGFESVEREGRGVTKQVYSRVGRDSQMSSTYHNSSFYKFMYQFITGEYSDSALGSSTRIRAVERKHLAII